MTIPAKIEKLVALKLYVKVVLSGVASKVRYSHPASTLIFQKKLSLFCARHQRRPSHKNWNWLEISVKKKSPIVIDGKTAYLSGQSGLDPDNNFKLVPGGIEPETLQTFNNIGRVLRSQGLSYEDVEWGF
ncbi:uncharacterized protein [Apostichopus japonicus]|uniref:uncharacterized protein n=1 Tax=Stichopus japonicus TaxID=307972 RepID=UPI003AB47C38